jgi:hypothetical protein
MSDPIDIPCSAPDIAASAELTHARVQLTPNDDPMLSFELLVPKVWLYSSSIGPVVQAPLITQGLGLFTPGGELGTPIVAVTVTRCPFEVAIDAWVRWRMSQEGWTILKAQWVPIPEGPFYDVTAHRTIEGGHELIRRTSVRADRGRIFSVNCSCDREHWDAVKHDFWAAHVTFGILGNSGDPTSEAWLRCSGEQPGFEAGYPASWQAEPAQPRSREMSGMHLRLTDPRHDVLLAYLFIQAERSDPRARRSTLELIDQAKTMLSTAGVQLTQNPIALLASRDPRAKAVQGWLGGCSAKATLGEAEVDIRFEFVQRDHVAFTVAMCNPPIADDAWTALRAQRAFEIVRSTLEAIEHAYSGGPLD